MAVAAWLVWRRGGFAAQRRALGLFLAQLALNGAWTPLFFGLRRPGLAFVEIVWLWLAIGATILAFRLVSRVAAGLLAPYLGRVRLEFNNVNSTTTPPLAAGTLSSAGTTTLNVNRGTFTSGQSYPLFRWTSGAAPAVSLGRVGGAVGNLATKGNTIQLHVTTRTLTFSRPDDVTFGGIIIGSVTDSPVANSGTLVQKGMGTLTLTGPNTYPGGGTSPVIVPIDPADDTASYRLLSTP
jgi:hypothetical protein